MLTDLPEHAKILWVSSPGGHFAELERISKRVNASPDSVWITSPSPQTVGPLEGRRVCWVDYVSPRDVKGALRALREAEKFVGDEKFDICISTGAAVAVPILLWARVRCRRVIYVESLARFENRSLSGKILSLAPYVKTLTQHPGSATRRWKYGGSVVSDFVATRDLQPIRSEGLNVVVTLGTIQPFQFKRAVDLVLPALDPRDTVFWQLGATEASGLPGDVAEKIEHHRLRALLAKSDVVISHAGVGTLLDSLGAGRRPILIPRISALREHVDDHQLQLSSAIESAGLAQTIMPGRTLERTDLTESANWSVSTSSPSA